MEGKKISKLLTINQAAEAMSVSYWTVLALIDEAYLNKKSRWKEGKHFIGVSKYGAKRRMIRIKPSAVLLDSTPTA